MRIDTGVTLLVMSTIGLGLSACGDDGSSQVSRAEFRREVNQLCVEEHAQIDELFADFPEEPTDDEIVGVIAEFATIFDTYRDGLREVGPPEGQQEAYESYLDLWDQHVARVEAAVGDVERSAELFYEEPESDPLVDLETELGLDTCASR